MWSPKMGGGGDLRDLYAVFLNLKCISIRFV